MRNGQERDREERKGKERKQTDGLQNGETGIRKVKGKVERRKTEKEGGKEGNRGERIRKNSRRQGG